MAVKWIVPPVAEQQLTGFIIAFESLRRGKVQRCEIWNHKPALRCMHDGRPCEWNKLSAGLRKSVHKWNDSRKALSA
jgi:hypothetical protein